jgi:predicted nucleic acid-binding protein
LSATVPDVVVDASAIVDLLVESGTARLISERLRKHGLHAPAHLDAEVLSVLGRLHRSGRLSARMVATRLARLAAASIVRHPVGPLLDAAWRLRENLRLVDGLYVALGDRLGLPVITTDRKLAAAVPSAELIGS